MSIGITYSEFSCDVFQKSLRSKQTITKWCGKVVGWWAVGAQSGEPLSGQGQGGIRKKHGDEPVLMGERDRTRYRELGEVL